MTTLEDVAALYNYPVEMMRSSDFNVTQAAMEQLRSSAISPTYAIMYLTKADMMVRRLKTLKA